MCVCVFSAGTTNPTLKYKWRWSDKSGEHAL